MTRLALFTLAATPLFAEFRAAAVKIDITPKTPKWLLGYGARQNTGVHDPIFHRIVVLDDGRSQFVLVSTDVCLFSPSYYDDAAARLEKETGIPPVNFWWTTTHTHSAPELGPVGIYAVILKGRSDHPVDAAYAQETADSLIAGIKQARAQLAPARLAIGTGAANANINRRARDVDGKISLGLNPDGPVDRQIGLIRLERPNGSPIALIANYAMHGTVLGGKWMQISGDAQGIVAQYVEQKIGAPMLYINGAAGNIAPIYTVTDTPRAGHLTEFNVLLGDKILDANRNIAKGVAEVKFTASEKILETPRKQGFGWTDELARYTTNSPDGTPLVRMPVRFLKLNDLAIWATPTETFCEITMAIRNQSPFTNTFYFGYTNGWLGYLPAKAAFAEGGYEPTTSPFSDRVEADLLQLVGTYLQSLPR